MVLAGILLVVMLAWIAAALLARAGVPPSSLGSGARGGARSAILGGVVAGALLGPTLLGRVAPELHEDLFVGARASREFARALSAEREAWSRAALAVGGDPAAIEESLRNDAALAAAERRWHQAAAEASAPQRLATVAMAMLILLLATPRLLADDDGQSVTGERLEPTAARRRMEHSRDRSRRWADACSIGLWSAGVPAILALPVLWLHGVQPASAAALWSVAALGVGAWGLSRIDRRIADEVEPGGALLATSAASVATVVAALLAAAAAWRLFTHSPSPLPDGEAPVAALLLVGAMLLGRAARPRPSVAQFAARWLLPPLAALSVVRIELLEGAAPWLILFAMLFSGDGRSIGAFIGATLGGGRPARHAMRLCLPAAAAAPSQLALGAVGVQTMILPGWIGLALVLGAVVIEATATLRPRVDRVIQDLDAPSE